MRFRVDDNPLQKKPLFLKKNKKYQKIFEHFFDI